MRRFAALTLVWLVFTLRAQADTYPRQLGIDAFHYAFKLTLADDSNEIHGEATVILQFVADDVREVLLDLASTANGKGMTVSSVTSGGRPVPFIHQDDRLRIPLPSSVPAGRAITLL